jgi:hypothetical protein
VRVSSQFPIIPITSPRQPYSLVAVVRDEEAVGSNPATPTPSLLRAAAVTGATVDQRDVRGLVRIACATGRNVR